MILTKLAAFGAGYVLGTRAGRDRYEQICSVAKQAAERLEIYGSDGTLARKTTGRRADGPST